MKNIKGNLILLFAALIWGSAFVAQSAAMDFVEPFTYNALRSYIAFVFLLPIIFIFRNKNITSEERKTINHNSIIGGICCGIVLTFAMSFQQIGISYTTAGKAGFITALYIIFVPIVGILFKKKTPKQIWLCVLIALVGFYLLCIKENFSIGKGDLLVLCCAICFSFQIIAIDYFNLKNIDGIMMSCVQFLVVGILSTIPMLLFETPNMTNIMNAKVTILYAGILSSGVAYTLQIIGQKYTDPTIATLLMSLESVFAALSGWLILHEVLSTKELIGCTLVFLAVILAQMPNKK